MPFPQLYLDPAAAQPPVAANPVVGAVGDLWRAGKGALGGDTGALNQGIMNEVKPPPPQDTTEDPLGRFPGTPGQSANAADTDEGAMVEDWVRRTQSPSLGGGGGGVGATIQPEGQNFHPVGGIETWNEVVQQGKDTGAAINRGAEAEAKQAETRAEFYKREQQRQQEEAALLEQRRMERQQQIDLQQQQLQQATQHYTNDLADQGKWWRSPGNIVSAFGAAMMTLGSNDPTIGMKIISQAVNTDFAQRKALADMHLGELRSNLGQYRQIAGDRDLGDRLAYAENNRVAAMEMDRIGQQFAGPIAKAKAAAISSEFMRNYNIQMMQLRQALGVYNAPRQIHPGVLSELKKAAENDPTGSGWRAYSAALGAVASGKAQIQAPGAAAPPAAANQAVTGFTNAAAKAVAAGTDKGAAMADKRYPGLASAVHRVRFSNIQSALIDAHIDPTIVGPNDTDAEVAAKIRTAGHDPAAKGGFNEKKQARDQADAKELADVSKLISPHASAVAGWKLLGNDMDVIEVTAKKLGYKNVDEMLDTREKQVLGSGNMKSLNEFLAAGTPNGPHEEQRKRVAEAISRYQQLLSGQIGAYIHENAGTALSKTELENLHQVISHDHSFGSVKNFRRMGEAGRQAEINSILAGVTNQGAKNIWNARLGTSVPQGIDRAGIQGPPQMGGKGPVINPVIGPPDDRSPPTGLQDPETLNRAIRGLTSPTRRY